MRDATQRALVLALSLAFTMWAGGFAFHQFVLPKLWGRPPAPQRAKTQLLPAGPGTDVYVPVSGDQCWDADLPCSPFHDQVEREHGSPGAGYVPR